MTRRDEMMRTYGSIVMLTVLAITASSSGHAEWPPKLPSIPKPSWPQVPVIKPPRTEYRTNKGEHVAKQEQGGWVLAWSADITETDCAQGIVAAGVSVYSGGTSFAAWVTGLVNRTLSSVAASAGKKFPAAIKSKATQAARDVITAAIRGKSAKQVVKNYDTVDFKAGAIRYTGGNYLNGQLIGGHTWGLKIYVGFRIR